MSGGRHFAKRPTDGRVLRAERSRARLAATVLAEVVARGIFQPKLSVVVELSGGYKQQIARLFGSRRFVLTHLARTAPAEIVDAIGLEPVTRARLTDRDVKAIAWAVLAGRRLEAHEKVRGPGP